jgi:MFS family permease
MSQASSPFEPRPSHVRYGVLGFVCILSMITYLDRVCFGQAAVYIQKEFGLSEVQKGLLFTAFAFAYAFFEVPSGWLGDVYGPRRTLIRIVLWWSLFTALTGCVWPFTLDSGYSLSLGSWSVPLLIDGLVALLVIRFLFGVGEAGAYPNIARALHNWFPFGERGFGQGAVWMAGRFMGGLAPMLVLALVYTSVGPGGEEVPQWRHTFWIFGILGVVWCISWWLWFRDRPEQHARVSPAELALIRGDRPPLGADPAPLPDTKPRPVATEITTRPGPGDGGDGIQIGTAGNSTEAITGARPVPVPPTEHDTHSPRGVPWGRLLTSGNLWTLCLMYFCGAYGWYFNITYLPGYLQKELHVTRQSHGLLVVGLLSGAPLLLGSLACLVGGLLTDAFIRRTGNRKWGRRLFGVIGHGACALCYFLSLAAPTPALFVLAVALAAFWNDLTMGSAWASCQDIGRQYCGIVSGCMNTVGNLGGAAAGFVTGWVLDAHKEHGWTINFLIFGGVYVVAMLLWLRFDATKPVVPPETPT